MKHMIVWLMACCVAGCCQEDSTNAKIYEYRCTNNSECLPGVCIDQRCASRPNPNAPDSGIPAPPSDPCAQVTCSHNAHCVDGQCAATLCVANACAAEDTLCHPSTGECEALTPAETYISAELPASYIDSLAIETDTEIGMDLNDDGIPNNVFGYFIQQLSGFHSNPDSTFGLQPSIDSGSLVLGLAWPSLNNSINAQETDIHLLTLDAVDIQHNQFTIHPSSFIEATGNPRIQLRSAHITDGSVETKGPSQFAFPAKVGGIPFNVYINNAVLIGDISLDDGRPTLTNAHLSGAVPLKTIFKQINAYLLSNACACQDKLIDFAPSSARDFACNRDFEIDHCNNRTLCRNIAATCSILIPVTVGQADINLTAGDPHCQDNRTCDALSAFVHLSAVGADFVGYTP